MVAIFERVRDALTGSGSPVSHLSATDLTVDEAFDILSNRRRRLVILLLDERPRTKAQLADEIAESEFGPEPSGAERKRVYVALHQTHLQRLADHDVVELGSDIEADRMVYRGPAHGALVSVLADLQVAGVEVPDDG